VAVRFYVAHFQRGGEGRIAVIDSGIAAQHHSFQVEGSAASRVVYSKDFTGEGRTGDPYGHGTHVASLFLVYAVKPDRLLTKESSSEP
jgi:hypothetical protein